MPEYQSLKLERRDHVATVTLNRPDALNAFDAAMRREILSAAREVNEDGSVRVVVLTGAGRGFGAGADLTEMTAGDFRVEDMLNGEYKPALLAIADAPKPWISAVAGPCAGISGAFALACDLTVMAEDAYLYQAFAAIGLIPDGGLSWHLVRILGRKRAYEMIVSGEKVAAERCLALGLCNRVVPAGEALEAALGWAAELAAKSPLALRYAKQALQYAGEEGLDRTISEEARLQHVCITSEDAKEGVSAFLEKRAPVWRGR